MSKKYESKTMTEVAMIENAKKSKYENDSDDKSEEEYRLFLDKYFAAWFIKNFAKESVLGEQLGRKCYMMELDPKYCDVIRKRYWKFKTGSEEGWQDGTKAI